jgi:hypothetical protein
VSWIVTRSPSAYGDVVATVGKEGEIGEGFLGQLVRLYDESSARPPASAGRRGYPRREPLGG